MRNPLTNRLVVILVATISIVVTIFIVARVLFLQAKFDVEIEKSTNRVANRISDAINYSLNKDLNYVFKKELSAELIASILVSELNDPLLNGILIYSRFGDVQFGMVQLSEGEVRKYDPKLHVGILSTSNKKRKISIPNNSIPLSEVEILFNSKYHSQKLLELLYIEITQLIVLALLIMALVYLGIRISLLKPLESLDIASSTFKCIEEGIVYVDLENNIIDVNKAFLSITGYLHEDVVDKDCTFFKFGESIDEHIDQVNASLIDGRAWSGEGNVVNASGQRIPISLTITDVKNEEGALLCRVYIFKDISHLKAEEAQLKNLAYFDPLTQLPNRRYFEEHIESGIRQAGRTQSKFGVLYIDLDKFKFINDCYGHSAGDLLLVEMAKRFRSRLRESDLLCRLGGDEFTIIANNIDSGEELAVLAKDLIKLAKKPFQFDDHTCYVGASIGISVYPQDATEAGELIRNADSAMYTSKHKGRETFAFYSQDIHKRARAQQLLKLKLTHAISNKAFSLAYQPKVALKSGRVIGAEALIRWPTENGKIVAPSEFIPFAEEAGLIQDIGTWVAETACARAKTWLTSFDDQFELSINLSSKQLLKPEIISLLRTLLSSEGLKPNNIDLEITEGSVIKDFERTIDTLNEFKEMGLSISLDDFGTGYSSMSYLTKLPIDTLKIDRSFIHEIGRSAQSETIIATIIAMAKSLSLSTVAEGIETHSQLNFLLNNGCDIGQGYYFSRPLSDSEFDSYLFKMAS